MAERESEGGDLVRDERDAEPEGGHELGTHEELVLAELVSRVLDRGVVVAGDVTISVAGIDLVHLALRLRLSSIESLHRRGERGGPGDAG